MYSTHTISMNCQKAAGKCTFADIVRQQIVAEMEWPVSLRQNRTREMDFEVANISNIKQNWLLFKIKQFVQRLFILFLMSIFQFIHKVTV
jgi:hypothetical protein